MKKSSRMAVTPTQIQTTLQGSIRLYKKPTQPRSEAGLLMSVSGFNEEKIETCLYFLGANATLLVGGVRGGGGVRTLDNIPLCLMLASGEF